MSAETWIDRFLGRSRPYQPVRTPKSKAAKSCAAVGETEEDTCAFLDAEIMFILASHERENLLMTRRRALVERVQAYERERCAKLADEYDNLGEPCPAVAYEIAAAIRALK